MTNKFAPTYRSLESSNYFFGSYMTNGRERVNARANKYSKLDFIHCNIGVASLLL